jgi:hypothetical protein
MAAGGAGLLFARAAAEARGGGPTWVDRGEYGPFQCQAAFPLASLAGVFDELGRLQLELQRTLAAPPSGQRVAVYLLADEANHRRFLQDLYPGLPYRRALYVQRAGQGAVYAYRHDELPIDLRHECTHALLHGALPAVPLWLDEGLAEYFEMPEHQRAYGHPHLAELRWRMQLGLLRKLESLETLEDLSQMGGMEYRYAWAWVHFMLHGPASAHRALVEHVAAIRRGEPAGSLSVRLRRTTSDLDARIIRHFQQWPRTRG